MSKLEERLRKLVDSHFQNPATHFNGDLRHTFVDQFIDDPELESLLERLLRDKQLVFVRHAQS